MSLRSISVSAFGSIFYFHAALAANVECFSIHGQVQIFPAAADTCPLIETNGDKFDLDFAFQYVGNPGGAEATCFSGELSGAEIEIEGALVPLEGTTESALFAVFPTGTPSAASVIRIRKPNILKGRLYSHDIINFDPTFSYVVGEHLEIKDGNRVYKNVTTGSYISIDGDVLMEPSNFEGEICL